MKTAFLMIFILVSVVFGRHEIYFAEDPNLSPDGLTLVFSYNNDLRTVNSGGGHACRITGIEGKESDPSYSPDGKWIAFTGR